MQSLLESLLTEGITIHGIEPLYHISFKEDLPSTLYPRQPDGSHSEPVGDNAFATEDLPPRISFSPSIQQCFAAIYANIYFLFEKHKYPYMVFHVYSPKRGTGKKLPTSLVRKKVWDSHYTEEECYGTPVEVVYVGKIKVFNPEDEKKPLGEIFVHPFDNKQLEERFLAPIIRFEVMHKIRSMVIK